MKHIFLILNIALLLLSTGCKITETETESRSEKIKLTEQEERLLCDLYIDEERIREGYLYKYQMETLNQIRFAVNYLEETYPNQTFELIMCHPKSKINMVTTISFREEGNLKKEYTLTIESNGDSYTAKDNYTDNE